ncbi:MAG: phenylalanine--tRNA ligase subunit alpha [Candidatus Heimdallarchaeaceae archaeon]
MSNSEDKVALPPEAIKLYKKISSLKEISMKELEKEMQLDRGKMEHILSFLISNEYVERTTTVEQKYKLTDAGRQAANKGLIERLIITALVNNPSLNFNELAEILQCDKQEMNAGIGYLKKLGLLQIIQGKLSLLDEKVEINKEMQEVLTELAKGNEVDLTKHQKELIQRNLASVEEIKDSVLKILIPYSKIKSLITETVEVSRLTPDMIRDGSWKTTKLRSYNLDVAPPTYYPGRKQPYAQFLDEVKQKLAAFGFQEMRGPIVELEYWNFDALFQAQDHPAREWSDVYRVSNPQLGKLPKEKHVKLVQTAHEDGYDTGSKGWRYKWSPEKSARLVLRAQGTSVSARTLVNLPVPSKYFSISRCFRPDTVDATHLSEFNQAEGIVADPSITFRDLLGILETFALDIAETDKFVFKPDYYPFTEPSVELSVRDPKLGNIEFGGAGIFRPEVVRPFDIDVPVIAWGLGIDRLFMVKYGITDIRELFSHKMEWLRSAKMS